MKAAAQAVEPRRVGAERSEAPGTRVGGTPRPAVGAAAQTSSGTRSVHEHLFEAVEALEAAAGAVHDALERGVDEVDGQRGLLRDALVHAAQHAAAADEVDALEDEVLRELGRGLPERAHNDLE